MQPGKRVGIRVKITMAFAIVFILLGTFFNVFAYRQIRSMLKSDSDRYLTGIATSLLAKTETAPVIIPLPDSGNYIRVLYNNGTNSHLLFQSPGFPANIRTPVNEGVLDTLQVRLVYLRNDNEDNPASLVLAVNNGPLEANFALLRRLLFAGSLFSAIVASVVAYLLSGTLLQPVQRIIRAARNINAQQLHEQIPVTRTGDEMEELTETINSMLLRIEEGLKQQQAFFASASHELKTPLAVIRMELESQLYRMSHPGNVQQLIVSQLDEVKRLEKTVQEFLLVSQLKAGGLQLLFTEFDVSDLVIKIFDQLKPLIKAKKLSVAVDFEENSDSGFMFVGDADRFKLVVINLLENVIKYGESGTNVAFRLTINNKNVNITLVNKTSVESMEAKNISDAFVQASMNSAGAGIGLWLCRQIISLHHGSIKFTSANHLFTVHVELPVRQSLA